MTRENLTFKSIMSVIILISLMMSCVSKKKYEEAVQEIARMKVDSTYGEYYLAKAKYKKDEVIYDLKDSIWVKAQKLDSLEAVLAQQENQLEQTLNIFDNIDSSILEVSRAEGKILLSIDDKLLFDSDSDVISAAGKKMIDDISAAIENLDENTEVWVVGHTDSRPFINSEMNNWELSTDRAISVAELLVKNNIKPHNLVAAGRSKFDPVSTNRTFEGRMLNRRTEIMIVPTVPLKLIE